MVIDGKETLTYESLPVI